nr:PREDICTED: uncharacterized protein LOC107075562 [Lepisosteus oculatus]
MAWLESMKLETNDTTTISLPVTLSFTLSLSLVPTLQRMHNSRVSEEGVAEIPFFSLLEAAVKRTPDSRERDEQPGVTSVYPQRRARGLQEERLVAGARGEGRDCSGCGPEKNRRVSLPDRDKVTEPLSPSREKSPEGPHSSYQDKPADFFSTNSETENWRREEKLRGFSFQWIPATSEEPHLKGSPTGPHCPAGGEAASPAGGDISGWGGPHSPGWYSRLTPLLLDFESRKQTKESSTSI